VCTVFGLAFRLYDPDGLLGGNEDLGITCALVPTRPHPGVDIGRRHFPLNAMFMNGPTRGKDVFMPLDFIIGGPKMAGQGWRMLMECLAAGALDFAACPGRCHPAKFGLHRQRLWQGARAVWLAHRQV
jgi:acyl-CoA dehydrogenase